jgi:hypothetical protein
MSGSSVQGADLRRRRARALIDRANNTHDLDEASDLLALAAEQLELAREDAPQQHRRSCRCRSLLCSASHFGPHRAD